MTYMKENRDYNNQELKLWTEQIYSGRNDCLVSMCREAQLVERMRLYQEHSLCEAKAQELDILREKEKTNDVSISTTSRQSVLPSKESIACREKWIQGKTSEKIYGLMSSWILFSAAANWMLILIHATQ